MIMFKARVPIQMHCNYWHRDANNRSIYREDEFVFSNYIKLSEREVFPGKRVSLGGKIKKKWGLVFFGGIIINQTIFSDANNY